MVIGERRLTIADYWQLAQEWADDELYELIEGVLVRVAPPKRINSWIAARLLIFLGYYVDQNNAGYVFGADGGYALDEETVRVPDVSFLKAGRDPKLRDMNSILSPDLAVEVISDSETPTMVSTKTRLYLQRGTSMVWNIYPETRVIEVWQQSDSNSFIVDAYTSGDTLTAPDLLPGFELDVTSVFPAQETSTDDEKTGEDA